MSSPIRMSGMTSGLDTESIVKALVSNYSSKVTKYTKEKTKLEWTQDAWKDINTKVYGLYSSIGNMRYSSAYSMRTATSSDTSKATVKASSDAPVGIHTLEVNKLARSAYLTSAKIGKRVSTDGTNTVTYDTIKSDAKVVDIKDASGNALFSGDGKIKVTVDGKETDIDVSKDTTVEKFAASLASAGLNASYDEKNQRLFISSKESGSDHTFSIAAASGDTNAANFLSALGLGSTAYSDGDGTYKDASGNAIADATDMAHMINSSDAEFTVDGAKYTSNTNSVTVNGLTINATGTTSEAINITTNADSQGLYDKIKDFLSQYNDVINDLNAKYNAASAKGYEPLTDDEKKAMSETQIEKYEDKIKTALLRRDGTVDSLISTMTNAMSKSYDVNGTTYSLTTFGIHTLGILNSNSNEQSALHIDGDSEDTNTSANKDKLMSAITDDPDGVMGFMQQLASGLYSNLDTKMKSTTMSSAYTVYNDKSMKKQVTEYTKLISDWQDKVDSMEDYYYNKFSKMESALTKLNSSSSAITGMTSSS
jgi:flagellar capping protein FliD